MDTSFDMYEAYTNQKADPTPQEPSPDPAASTFVSFQSGPNTRLASYQFQASPEDQALTNEVMELLLGGKLAQITLPTSSPPVHPSANRLRTTSALATLKQALLSKSTMSKRNRFPYSG
jgi:hypothetical protein